MPSDEEAERKEHGQREHEGEHDDLPPETSPKQLVRRGRRRARAQTGERRRVRQPPHAHAPQAHARNVRRLRDCTPLPPDPHTPPSDPHAPPATSAIPSATPASHLIVPSVVIEERQRACERGVGASSGGIDEEEAEVLVVVEPDAVVHPRAVVIHLHHASAADGAVVRARRLPALALAASAPPIAKVFEVGPRLEVLDRRQLVAGEARPRQDASPVIK